MNKQLQQFKIEKGLPIPKGIRRSRSGIASAIRLLELGDSVFFPFEGTSGEMKIRQSRLSTLGWLYRPKKFTVRQVNGGFRIWRTA